MHPPLLAYNLSIKTNVSPKNFEEEAELTNHLSEPEASQSLMNTEPAISPNAPFCHSQQGRGAIKIKHWCRQGIPMGLTYIKPLPLNSCFMSKKLGHSLRLAGCLSDKVESYRWWVFSLISISQVAWTASGSTSAWLLAVTCSQWCQADTTQALAEQRMAAHRFYMVSQWCLWISPKWKSPALAFPKPLRMMPPVS